MFGIGEESPQEKRFKEIENALMALGGDIGACKAQIARINAKLAVEARIEHQRTDLPENVYKDIAKTLLRKKVQNIYDVTDLVKGGNVGSPDNEPSGSGGR